MPGQKKQDRGKEFQRIYNELPSSNAVDGRNPTPVDEVFFPLVTGLIHPMWLFGISSINSRVSFELPFPIDPGFWLFVVWGYTPPGLYRDLYQANKRIPMNQSEWGVIMILHVVHLEPCFKG